MATIISTSMAQVFVDLIRNPKSGFTLEMVPARWKAEVIKLLQQEA